MIEGTQSKRSTRVMRVREYGKKQCLRRSSRCAGQDGMSRRSDAGTRVVYGSWFI